MLSSDWSIDSNALFWLAQVFEFQKKKEKADIAAELQMKHDREMGAKRKHQGQTNGSHRKKPKEEADSDDD